ncbi:hypothetical protein [Collimonas sp.]|jgi:hypothetical protein|uniref:hypothetical protein n=1 Tax=Collimonas sp. TaxID=1963772 RepID=UPI002CE33BA4|nr:hypothetical protein [Collimonas sp.]HWW08184.1 hypothetical protein [Collimonas sp.]
MTLLFFAPLIVVYASLIAKQLIREQLIARILKDRSYALDISSDWHVSPKLGYASALKKSTVWGDDSRAMLKIQGLRCWILAARIASVVQNIGTFVIFSFFGWIIYTH